MSAEKRSRSVANADVLVVHYRTMIAEWFRSFDGNVHKFLGPALAKDQRGVTPVHVIRLSALLQSFIGNGLQNGVVLAMRLEAGVSAALADQPEKAPKGINLDVCAHELTEHVRFSFNILRYLRLERDSPNPSGVSKTSAFTRRARATELVVINNLVSKMHMNASVKQNSSADADDKLSSTLQNHPGQDFRLKGLQAYRAQRPTGSKGLKAPSKALIKA